MISFYSKDRDPQELYRLLIGCIVPRPIGFISTRSKAGLANLSPFSFFNGVTGRPPTLAFSCSDRGEEMKDTSRNIQERPEFIVHIVSEPIAEQMNTTCGDFGPHVDEFAQAGLTAAPGTSVEVPRVAEALVAMECKVTHHLRLGERPPHTSHILGEVVYWHLDERLPQGKSVDASVLQAVGRMGGIGYTRTQDSFELVRPVVTDEDPRSIPAFKAGQATPLPR